jgi:uncharacterized membrane protein YeaQ/YmgE (transglycosylase-associated protein family)
MVIGFIAGVLAARVFHVPGFGVLGDVALGLAGALISAISTLLAGVGMAWSPASLWLSSLERRLTIRSPTW